MHFFLCWHFLTTALDLLLATMKAIRVELHKFRHDIDVRCHVDMTNPHKVLSEIYEEYKDDIHMLVSALNSPRKSLSKMRPTFTEFMICSSSVLNPMLLQSFKNDFRIELLISILLADEP